MTSRKSCGAKESRLGPFPLDHGIGNERCCVGKPLGSRRRTGGGMAKLGQAEQASLGPDHQSVVNRFAVRTRPVSVSIRTKSVKVPPMSQPMRNPRTMGSSPFVRDQLGGVQLVSSRQPLFLPASTCLDWCTRHTLLSCMARPLPMSAKGQITFRSASCRSSSRELNRTDLKRPATTPKRDTRHWLMASGTRS